MWRPLAHFVWIGVALFAVDRIVQGESEAPAPVVVASDRVAELGERFLAQMGRAPDEAELSGLIQAEVDDELLYREALARGFDRDDPVIFRRLVQNMRFADAADTRDAAALYAEALELGMDRRDPVVRRRLVQRMRLAIEAAALEPEPDDTELRAVYDGAPERYAQPARVRLHQLYFTADGADRAEAVRATLPEAGPPLDAPRGDPFLHGADQPLQSRRELAQRFGAEFADAAFALPVGMWSGPVGSAYGVHLVWVAEQREATLPPLEAVRDRVRHAALAARREQALQDALAELRARTPQVIAGP